MTKPESSDVRRSPRLAVKSTATPTSSPKPKKDVKSLTPKVSPRSAQDQELDKATQTLPLVTTTPIKTISRTEESQINVESKLETSASPNLVKEEVKGATGGGVAEINISHLSFQVDGVTSYAVVPLSYCPHLLEINSSPDLSQIDAFKPCSVCQDHSENWICLTCFGCFCSRYVKSHMLDHFDRNHHAMALSFSDLSVWCYECESYVDNSLLDTIKQAAYKSKFG